MAELSEEFDVSEHTHAQGGIQRGPRRADNFSIISNDVINDDRLSYTARGILLYLLSKPADWRTRSQSIADRSPQGRESVRSAMRELKALGYLVCEKVRDSRTGRISTVQTVYEVPVEVTESQVTPAPRMPVTRVADTENPGAFTRTEAPRTKTNNNSRPAQAPRQCTTNPSPSLSEKVHEIQTADAAKLADLEQATSAVGLPASYERIKPAQRTEILELIDRHGIPALTKAAAKAHRDDSPTLYVTGWLRLWRALPAPRVTPTPPTVDELRRACDDCVGGWIEDADGLPVRRCACCAAGSATRA